MNKHLESVNRTWDILPFWFKVKIYLICLFYAWLHYVKLWIGLQAMR